LVVEAVPCQPADLEVLDQDVTASRQPQHELLAAAVGNIDADGALAAVGSEEVGGISRSTLGFGREERRAPAARIVAGFGPLDLDDLGTKVRKRLARPRPGKHPAQIEDANTCKRPRHDTSSVNPRTDMRYRKHAGWAIASAGIAARTRWKIRFPGAHCPGLTRRSRSPCPTGRASGCAGTATVTATGWRSATAMDWPSTPTTGSGGICWHRAT